MAQKNSYKQFDNKQKKFLRLENSPPPGPSVTFLMVRPLRHKRGPWSLCQAVLAETVETGTKNRCVIEATHVLRRKLRKG